LGRASADLAATVPAMKVRIGIGAHGLAVPSELQALVLDMADLGFDSLWLSDVLTAPGFDALAALTWAAALHPTLKLGATLLLPGRNEVRLAKTVASVDALSEGRLLVTFVPGLARGVEREAIGVPVAERGAAIERTLPRLRRWWAGEEVDGITVGPRPVQDPFDVWLGGMAPRSLERCGRYADGWLPSLCTPVEAAAGKRIIDDEAAAAGRSISPEHFGVSLGYSREPLDDGMVAALAPRTRDRSTDPRLLVPVGYDDLREQLLRFIEVGFTKFVVRPLRKPASWRAELDGLAAAVGDLQTPASSSRPLPQ
jgi:probable F420-dependent oxidoreductase